MEVSSIDPVLRNVLKRLMFFGEAKAAHKLQLKTEPWDYVQDNLATSINRTFWTRDNRRDMCQKIQKTIDDTNLALHTYQNSPYFEQLLINLELAGKGLDTIKKTYNNDIDIKSDINIFIMQINKLIEQFKPRI